MQLWKGPQDLVFILAAFPDYPSGPSWKATCEQRASHLKAFIHIASMGEAELHYKLCGPLPMRPRRDYTAGLRSATEEAIRLMHKELAGYTQAFVLFNEPGATGLPPWSDYPQGWFFPGSEVAGAGYALRDTTLGVMASHWLDRTYRGTVV